jgi:hypothetical protein
LPHADLGAASSLNHYAPFDAAKPGRAAVMGLSIFAFVDDPRSFIRLPRRFIGDREPCRADVGLSLDDEPP